MVILWAANPMWDRVTIALAGEHSVLDQASYETPVPVAAEGSIGTFSSRKGARETFRG